MRRAIALLFIVLSAAIVAAPLVPGTNTDAEIAAMLVGTWTRAEPDCYSEKSFQPGGTASGFILDLDEEGTVAARTEFISNWTVQDGRLNGEVLQSSDPELLPAGASFSDEIVSVSDERFEFMEAGQPAARLRKHAPSAPEAR